MSCASFPMAKAVCGWCGHWRSRRMRTGSSSIAISTWTICASTKRRRCAVLLDPRPVQPSTVLARSRTLRAGSRRCRRRDILDCRCARRSARGKVGTMGWSLSIEQRDVAFALSSASPSHDQFAELDAHNYDWEWEVGLATHEWKAAEDPVLTGLGTGGPG